jgi:hypothetical protein
MPARRTPRPLVGTQRPRHIGKPDMRDYSGFKFLGNRPSQRFDWDAALYRHALIMRDLGYKLSPQQQQRIDDHA